MTDVKKYIWAVPIIGGIFAIVALLTPVASMNLSLPGMSVRADLWLWGLYDYNFAGIDVGSDFIMLGGSVIITLIIASGGILLIGSSVGLRKNLRNVRNFSIIAGMLILVAELLWVIVVPTGFPMEQYWGIVPPGVTLTFWTFSYMGVSLTLHAVGFGFIGGILAVVIAFGGAGAAHYYSKEREVIVPEKKEISPPTKEPIVSETPELKFCPECGAELEDPDIKFCGKCGFDLKPPELAPL